jgi:hypothetical protein
MRAFCRTVVLVCLLLACLAGTARAQAVKTFSVLPFEVYGSDKYAYLKHGIQSMLVSRLTWRDHFQPLDNAAVAKAKVGIPASDAEGLKSLSALGSDYLIWGSVTVSGDDASLDVHVLGQDGKSWPKSRTVKIDEIVPSLEGVAKEINADIFERPAAQAKSDKQAAPAEGGARNPDLVYAREDPNQPDYYLNPQFRYEGDPESPGQWRSQSLNFPTISMIIVDADSDGQKEVFFLEEKSIKAYRMRDRKLDLIAEYSLPMRTEMLKLSSLDVNRDGYAEIMASGWTEEGPWTVVLNFRDEKFVLINDRVTLFLNVIQMPPEYTPTLIGQEEGQPTPFKSPVHEVASLEGHGTKGKRLVLPEFANVYNIGFLPQPDGNYFYLTIDGEDRIRVWSKPGEMLAVTGESYGSSPIGLDVIAVMPGLGQRSIRDENEEVSIYIPNRLILAHLGKDKNYELIVNRNISVAADFFSRYRNFPYGEVHSLYWDGVGLSLQWKTRRLKGTVVDYCIADIDNDGADELCVAVNTYKGMTGLTDSRTVVMAYELDMSKTAPVAPAKE